MLKLNASASVTAALGLITSLVLLSSPAHAKTVRVEFDSNQLLMKSADQISDLVRRKIDKAHKIQAQQETDDDAAFQAEPEAVDQLRDAMRIVLARPDQDGTRDNAFSRLRRELIDLNSLDKVLGDLADEGTEALKSDRTSPTRAGTYLVLLNNMLAELKPEVSSNEGFKHVVEQIRDAKIELSDKVKSSELLRTMSAPASPSETAGKILAQIPAPKSTPKKK